MTQHLETLKGILQGVVSEPTFGIQYYYDFIEAVQDGIYSCQFETEIALEQWIQSWKIVDMSLTGLEKQYQQGVQFVAEQWEQIKGEMLCQQ